MKGVFSTNYMKGHYFRKYVDEETRYSVRKRSVSNTEGTKDNIILKKQDFLS